MSGYVNKVIMIGNLGADPEIRIEPDKYNVCTLNIATNRDWKDQNSGETKSQTYWHRVVIWEPNAVKYAKDYLKSGTKVYVEGKLETRKWQDQSDTDRYTTEVVIRQNSGRLVGLDSQDIISGGNDLGRQDGLSRIENGDMPF